MTENSDRKKIREETKTCRTRSKHGKGTPGNTRRGGRPPREKARERKNKRRYQATSKPPTAKKIMTKGLWEPKEDEMNPQSAGQATQPREGLTTALNDSRHALSLYKNTGLELRESKASKRA